MFVFEESHGRKPSRVRQDKEKQNEASEFIFQIKPANIFNHSRARTPMYVCAYVRVITQIRMA